MSVVGTPFPRRSSLESDMERIARGNSEHSSMEKARGLPEDAKGAAYHSLKAFSFFYYS